MKDSPEVGSVPEGGGCREPSGGEGEGRQCFRSPPSAQLVGSAWGLAPDTPSPSLVAQPCPASLRTHTRTPPSLLRPALVRLCCLAGGGRLCCWEAGEALPAFPALGHPDWEGPCGRQLPVLLPCWQLSPASPCPACLPRPPLWPSSGHRCCPGGRGRPAQNNLTATLAHKGHRRSCQPLPTEIGHCQQRGSVVALPTAQEQLRLCSEGEAGPGKQSLELLG